MLCQLNDERTWAELEVKIASAFDTGEAHKVAKEKLCKIDCEIKSLIEHYRTMTCVEDTGILLP